MRDLEYVIETPGTAMRLLPAQRLPVHPAAAGPNAIVLSPSSSILSLRSSGTSGGKELASLVTVFARMLRLSQGMDPQERNISGGHVEYEQNRWLVAFGLSLNVASTRDALAECQVRRVLPVGRLAAAAIINAAATSGSDTNMEGFSAALASWLAFREAMGSFVAALLRELKMWLYREGLLETSLPAPSGGPHGGMDLAEVGGTTHMVALSCATGVKNDGNAVMFDRIGSQGRTCREMASF